jgi:hypothetical protein
MRPAILCLLLVSPALALACGSGSEDGASPPADGGGSAAAEDAGTESGTPSTAPRPRYATGGSGTNVCSYRLTGAADGASRPDDRCQVVITDEPDPTMFNITLESIAALSSAHFSLRCTMGVGVSPRPAAGTTLRIGDRPHVRGGLCSLRSNADGRGYVVHGESFELEVTDLGQELLTIPNTSVRSYAFAGQLRADLEQAQPSADATQLVRLVLDFHN